MERDKTWYMDGIEMAKKFKELEERWLTTSTDPNWDKNSW